MGENEKTNVAMTEEEIRQDLVNQMNESEENDPCDPAETPADVGGLNVGAIGAIGAGVLTLGLVGRKVYKDIKSGKLKERIDGIKEHHGIQRNKRQTIRGIRADSRAKIKAARHPADKTPAETPEGAAPEATET